MKDVLECLEELYESIPGKFGPTEFVVWDKDLICQTFWCKQGYFEIKDNKCYCKNCGKEHHKIKAYDTNQDKQTED